MSIKKVRVSRAIGANVGVTRAYKKAQNLELLLQMKY